MFGSNSIKNKSINDWNKTIHKIHFSSELLLKLNGFIKLVKNTFVTANALNPIQDGGGKPLSPHQFLPCNFFKRRN